MPGGPPESPPGTSPSGAPPAFDSGAPAKKLLVKAGEETKKYMDGWDPESNGKQCHFPSPEHHQAACKIPTRVMIDADSSIPAYQIPAHLKDLTSEELPEEHRGSGA
ncbi:hypothetical protein V8E36_001218 [Tilletia maclaganii]